ncbi:hypothetical protein F7734_52115 [Scytonema sp. UIC 10036]|uniref:hypothetical protein n=1 Tax=Scytonema sp. UIC 10036 TaxID=2304196 RepID=UPI0012DA228A|nr:hypothetical protein [Scytonema sp. UIC 10036]MUH00369.1 hypothetical protein [Scytonema sp. UIC 10036]
MKSFQLNLTLEERSQLKKLISDRQLTEALDLLRAAARRDFLYRRHRVTEEELVAYLAIWQRLLDLPVKETFP